MIKKGILLFNFIILAWSLGLAQPLSVKLKMEGESNYPLIVKAKSSKFQTFAFSRKYIHIGSQIEDYFTVYTNGFGLRELYQQNWIEAIQDGKLKMIPLMDSSRILNNIDSVHSGIAPLISDYMGRNVLIGIIDFGIEWRHLDFKDDSNKTRILEIWDQNKDSIAPTGYAYGHLWTHNDIDSGRCSHNASLSFGHGTQVSGIATGNGKSYYQNRGVAPESKIIAVSLKNNNAWLSNVIDGIQYIFERADSLGIPAIINISVGSYDGSHDGRDPSTRMIEATLGDKGRAIVAAMGNAGHINQHIRFEPMGDTLFTDFQHTPAYNGTYFNFWADTSDVRGLVIGIQADSLTNLLPMSNSYFFPFKDRFLDSLIVHGYYEDSMDIKNSMDSILGKAYFYVLGQENTVNFQCYIVPKNTNQYWRFTATGNGRLDMWVYHGLHGSSHIVSTGLPSAATNPQITKYKLSDQDMSITSGFQCSDKIISVGNYVNKFGITDIDTIYQPIGGKQGEIASNSSKGPTRDGRIKPDLSATGGQILTTIDSITSANFAAGTNRKKLGVTGQYSVAGGTSMASPIVAGSLALLLEKNSNFNQEELLYLLKKTCKRDSFTTAIANNTYGHGKLDAFHLLSYTPTYGCRDTGSINYNPLSDFEDSSLCIKKVYGCMDTGSINYNPVANVDDGSCIKKIYGCTDTGSINYNASANIDDGSCIKKVYGCTDTGSVNYNSLANIDDGSCIKKKYGCTDTGSVNYNPVANVDDGSCIKKIYGCTDSTAINYNPLANTDDGSCHYIPSSVYSSSKKEVLVFPNPCTDHFFISTKSQKTNIYFTIYSSLGAQVYSNYLKDNTEINVSNWSRGVYLITFFKTNKIHKIRLLLK